MGSELVTLGTELVSGRRKRAIAVGVSNLIHPAAIPSVTVAALLPIPLQELVGARRHGKDWKPS
jgi:hypothetical protein